MTCEEVLDFLGDYESGELDPAVRARFDEHLAICADCVRYVESYRKTVALSKAAMRPDDTELASVPEALVRAILRSRGAAGAK
jgi:anti-sigma factor RsiW